MTCSSPLPVPALVLAGGKTSPEFAQEAGVPERALADINGWPMVRYVLRALREASSVSRVVLVAPPGFPDQPEADTRVDGAGGLVENIREGLRQSGGASHALIVTADIPFVTPAAVDEYARECAGAGVDVCYGAIPLEACLRRFPDMRRTSIRTPEGALTGGNIVFQRIASFERQAALLARAYRGRKNPLFLAQLIGLPNVLKFMTRRLTVADIEAAASRVMGVRCRIIITPHPELGTDVDRPDDLRLARKLLRPPAA